MKVSLLLCVVMLSAISASGQCTHEPIGKPLRVWLLLEDSTPIVVQNAFMNGLRSTPDVVVGTAMPAADVVVFVKGFENKDTNGKVIGGTWYYRVIRWWHCAGPVLPPLLAEEFDETMSVAPLSKTEASVQDDVATINVKTFEKLRQERDASKRP
jgi:hypothetical protein